MKKADQGLKARPHDYPKCDCPACKAWDEQHAQKSSEIVVEFQGP